MAAPSYSAGDAYVQSLLTQYGTDPTLDPKLLDQLTKARALRDKLVLGFDATQAKRELAQLAAEQKLYDSVNSTIKSILETKGKDSRVTSQNFTDLKETKDKVDAQLALKLSAPTPPWASADAAYTKAGGKNAGAPAVAAAADALVKWTDPMGKGVDASYSEIAPLMNRYSIQALGKPLDQVKDPQELVDAMGNVAPTLQASFGQLARAGWTRYNDINGLLKQNQADKEWFGESAGRFQAGTATADDLARLRSMAQELGPRLIEATGRDAADVAMQRQLLLEENDRIKQADAEVEELRSLIFKTKADPVGRLVASEGFRKWALANSYSPGVATVNDDGSVTYQPSEDDAEAVWLYNWQAKHPGRYHPLRRTKPTGAYVRVTVQDPAAREAVIKEYRGIDGQMYMKEGELVQPAEAQQALIDGGFVPSVEYAEVDGKSYLRTPDGRVIDVATGGTTTDTVDAKAFKPALYYDNAAGSVRYLAPSDVDTADEITKLDSPTEGQPGMGVMEDSDKDAIARHVATAPIKPATENEVRGKWTGVYRGRLDAMLASDIVGTRMDSAGNSYGPNAISLDGGRVIIPGNVPATIEVMKVDSPSTGLRGIAAGWRQRMSDREAERLSIGAEIPVGTASPNLSAEDQRRIDTKTAARLADVAAAEFVGQPTPVVEPKMVTVTTTGPGGTVETTTVPADSAAARIAVATGKQVEDVGPELQRYETADGKVYEVKADGSTTLVEGAAAGEKTSWTPEQLAGDTALVDKLKADTTRNVSTPSGVEVPGMPALPEGVDVSRYGSRAVVRYPGQPAEPSFLERVGAGAAELVGDIKELPARMRGGGAAGAGAAGAGAGATPAGATPAAGAAPAGGQAPAPGAAPGAAPAPGAPTPEEKSTSFFDLFRRRREAEKQAKAAGASDADVRRAVEAASRGTTEATDIVGVQAQGEAGPYAFAPGSESALGRGEAAARAGFGVDETTGAAAPRKAASAEDARRVDELTVRAQSEPRGLRGELLQQDITQLPLPEVASPGMSPEALKRGSDIATLDEFARGKYAPGTPQADILAAYRGLMSQREAAARAKDLERRTGEAAPKFDAAANAAELRKLADEVRRLGRPPGAARIGLGRVMEGRAEGDASKMEVTTGTGTPMTSQGAQAPVVSGPAVTPESVLVGAPGPGSVSGLARDLVETKPEPESEPQKARLPSPWAGDPAMLEQIRDLPTYAQLEARRKVLEGVIRPQPKLGPRRDTIMPTAPSPADIEASRGPVRRDEKKEPVNQPANIEFSPGLGGANEALFFSMPGGPEAYMQRLREAAKKSSSKLPMFSSYVNGGK